MMKRLRTALVFVASVVLSACAAVRPVAVEPTIPTPPAYATVEAPLVAAAADSKTPQKPSAALQEGPWWTAFADSTLDAVIREAIENNYTIRDLRTLIYENQLDPEVPRGFLWPLEIGIPATAQHLRAAFPPSGGKAGFGMDTNQVDVGIAATYQLDVWGQLDMQRRIGDDLVEQQRQSTERFAQTLAIQVAQLWFDILELRALRELLDRQVQYNQELFTLVQARFEQQLVTRLVVLQQEQQLLNTRAQVPLVAAQQALLNSRLRALLGRTPTQRAELVPSDRRLPDLPPAPAIGVPGDLRHDHPDMRLARARVAEAEHLVSQSCTISL